MEYVVYILHNISADKFYIGYTNDITRRLWQHNHRGVGWTKNYKPWEVVYTKSFGTKIDAMKIERYLKSLKNREVIKKCIERNDQEY